MNQNDLAKILGFTPETHSECYDVKCVCDTCGRDSWLCHHPLSTYTREYKLSMPEVTDTKWLKYLVEHPDFKGLIPSIMYIGYWGPYAKSGLGDTPVKAIVNAIERCYANT